MKKLLLYSSAILLLALFAASCDNVADLDVQKSDAVLTWSGDYAADGCGYSIQIAEKQYKPENEHDINSSFKKNMPIDVEVKYVKLNRNISYFCGLGKTEKEGIKIIAIKEI